MKISGPVFMIVYEDVDVLPEVFAGEQAEECAHRRFKQARDHWNVSLFQRIDDGAPHWRHRGEAIMTQTMRSEADWAEMRDWAIDLQRQRDALSDKLKAMTKWLEKNQPDVFRRGIWDAISGSSERQAINAIALECAQASAKVKVKRSSDRGGKP